MTALTIILSFLISLIISGVIIFAAAKLFGEKEGYGTALLAALIGALIYTVAYSFIPGFWASLIGGIAWLVALGTLYGMGWLKSFVVAVVIWLFAALVSYILPTVLGPL